MSPLIILAAFVSGVKTKQRFSTQILKVVVKCHDTTGLKVSLPNALIKG